MNRYFLGALMTVTLTGCASKKNVVATDALNTAASGQTLEYLVDNEREFQIDIVYAGDDGLEFDWSFPENDLYGTIVVTGWALDNSAKMYNYFSPSEEKEVLTEETSVWVSNYVFNAASKGEGVTIFTGESDVYFEPIGNDTYTFTVDGQPTKADAIVLADEDGQNHKIWILDNADNPLILRMDIEFSVALQNVLTAGR